MQEEVLKLVLLALEDGSALSRKVTAVDKIKSELDLVQFCFARCW